MLESVSEKDVPCCCTKAKDYEMCSRFVRAFEIIGKKWNGLIISSLCKHKSMRFKDLAHAIGACSDRVLVSRLKELEEEEIVNRSVEDGIISYSLTEKGADLAPVFKQVHVWADKWA